MPLNDSELKEIISGMWRTAFFPGMMIVTTVLSINQVDEDLLGRLAPTRETKTPL